MFGLGAGEILIILAFALIFIGPKKLPDLARNLGKGIREFNRAKDDLMSQVNSNDDNDSNDNTNQIDEIEDTYTENIEEEDHHEALTGVGDQGENVDDEVTRLRESLGTSDINESANEAPTDDALSHDESSQPNIEAPSKKNS